MIDPNVRIEVGPSGVSYYIRTDPVTGKRTSLGAVSPLLVSRPTDTMAQMFFTEPNQTPNISARFMTSVGDALQVGGATGERGVTGVVRAGAAVAALPVTLAVSGVKSGFGLGNGPAWTLMENPVVDLFGGAKLTNPNQVRPVGLPATLVDEAQLAGTPPPSSPMANVGWQALIDISKNASDALIKTLLTQRPQVIQSTPPPMMPSVAATAMPNQAQSLARRAASFMQDSGVSGVFTRDITPQNASVFQSLFDQTAPFKDNPPAPPKPQTPIYIYVALGVLFFMYFSSKQANNGSTKKRK